MSLKNERRDYDLEARERSLTERKPSLWRKIKELEGRKGMQVFLWITLAVLVLYGIFAFLYTTVVLYTSGAGTSFLWFWPLTFGIALVAVIGLFLVLTDRLLCLKTAAMLFCSLFWLCLIGFLAVEAVIFSAGRKAPEPSAEYVVILGAQVRGETPSLVLNARIQAAAGYLTEYPEAMAVASGGQGSGESISEAEAIKRGLMRLGIAEKRILLENRSTSTSENLSYSAEIIRQRGGELTAGVVLVTNDFHVYRAVRLAEKLGYTEVSGLGVTDFFAVTIQYYVREFFAVILEGVRGNF